MSDRPRPVTPIPRRPGVVLGRQRRDASDADPRRRGLLAAQDGVRRARQALEAAMVPESFRRSQARSTALSTLRAAERAVDDAARAFEAALKLDAAFAENPNPPPSAA